MGCAEQPAGFGLADSDVAGREVGKDESASERGKVAGRSRSPYVLAQLDVEDEAWQILGRENHIHSEGDGLTSDLDGSAFQVSARSEPTLFVEFPIIRQMSFGNNTQNAPTMDGDSAIVESSFPHQRRADEQNRRKLAARGRDFLDRLFHPLQQRGLAEKIVNRVTAEAQFREHHQRNTLARTVAGERERLSDIVAGIGDFAFRCTGSHANETLLINRIEAHPPVSSRVLAVPDLGTKWP